MKNNHTLKCKSVRQRKIENKYSKNIYNSNKIYKTLAKDSIKFRKNTQ